MDGLGLLIWVVRLEAQDDVALRVHHEGIAAHGHARERVVVGIVACVFVGADNGLEVVAVEMERVFAGIVAVEDDFDNLVFLENEGVGVAPVDGNISCGVTCGQSSVEGRNFWRYVCFIVEEGTIQSILVFQRES